MIRYSWAAPNTVIGLLFVPIVLLTKGRLQIVDGVIELHCPVISTMLRYCITLPGGACAITLGHVVLGRDARSLALTRAHERVHVRQYELWGPFFIPAYVLASIWAVITRSGAYEGNFFERQAMDRE